jgi:RNA polymerase sigma-70 factor (ECF subfamily)
MTDAELVRRVLAGDGDAFATLVERYHERCARFALRMLGHREDAEDAVQETWMRAHRALGRYREQDVFRAWLFRILINQCRTVATRRRRRWRTFVADEEALALAADRGARPDGRLVLGDVQRALAAIDPMLREAFLLKHVEQLDYDEISAATGVGVSALKMRVKRACDALRARLEER